MWDCDLTISECDLTIWHCELAMSRCDLSTSRCDLTIWHCELTTSRCDLSMGCWVRPTSHCDLGLSERRILPVINSLRQTVDAGRELDLPPKNVETLRFRGNPGWGRLRGGDVLSSLENGSAGIAVALSRRGSSGDDPFPWDRCRRSGDAPIGGSPRDGASLHSWRGLALGSRGLLCAQATPRDPGTGGRGVRIAVRAGDQIPVTRRSIAAMISVRCCGTWVTGAPNSLLGMPAS